MNITGWFNLPFNSNNWLQFLNGQQDYISRVGNQGRHRSDWTKESDKETTRVLIVLSLYNYRFANRLESPMTLQRTDHYNDTWFKLVSYKLNHFLHFVLGFSGARKKPYFISRIKFDILHRNSWVQKSLNTQAKIHQT